MTTIKVFDKKNAKALQDDMEKALQAVAEKYGIEIKQYGGSLDVTSAVLKFKCISNDEEAAKRDWDRYCHMYGFTEDMFGVEFRANGKRLKVVGIEHSRPKYCLIAKDLDTGERRFFSRDTKHLIQRQMLVNADDE